MDMNEKEEMSAKDLYIWRKGEDDYGIEVLSALNKIIDGIKELGECGEWQDIAERVDWRSASCLISEKCDKIYSTDELFEIADNFAAIRILLFGDKIDYTKLLEVLRKNVNECGWTKEKRLERIKKRTELEEQQRNTSSPVGNGKENDYEK